MHAQINNLMPYSSKKIGKVIIIRMHAVPGWINHGGIIEIIPPLIN
jgi:hypothetical protein